MWAQVPMPFSDGYRLVDDDGENYIDDVYDYIDYVSSYKFMAVKNGQFGYINSNGKVGIPFKYDIAYPFKGQFALVGKDGKYYHINEMGQVLDTLDNAMAPMVVNKRFLLRNNKNNSAILNSQGEVVYTSKNRLLATADTRTLDWDEKKKLCKIIMTNSSGTTTQIAEYSNVDKALVNPDGVPILKLKVEEVDYVYVFPVSFAEPFRIEDKDFFLSGIRVFDYWIFLPKKGDQYKNMLEDGSGRVMFHSADLKSMMDGYAVRFLLNLPDDYTDHRFAQIFGFDKWVVLKGNEIMGNDLYDEISAKDNSSDFIMVRKEDSWFAHDSRQEIETPLKSVHPAPVWNNVAIGSVNFNSEKYALFNLKTGEISEEVFDIPLNNIRKRKDELYPSFYGDSFTWLDRDLAILNKSGKAVLVDQDLNILRESDVSYTPQADFSEYRQIKLSGTLKDAGTVDSFSGKVKRSFSKKLISLYLQNKPGKLKLHLVNNTKEKLSVEVQDGVPSCVLEYEKSPGLWEPMSKMEDTFCGNSFYQTELPPGAVQSSELNYGRGTKSIKVRFAMYVYGSDQPVYSNVVNIAVNPGLLWVTDYFPPYGL